MSLEARTALRIRARRLRCKEPEHFGRTTFLGLIVGLGISGGSHAEDSGSTWEALWGVPNTSRGRSQAGPWTPYLRAGVLFSKNELKYSGNVEGTTFAKRVTGTSDAAFFGIGTTFDLGSGWALQADFTHVMDAAGTQFGQSDSHNLSFGLRRSF